MRKEAEKELVDAGVVSAADIAKAAEKARKTHTSILVNLFEDLPSERCRAVTEILARQYKIPLLSLSKVTPQQSVLKRCKPEQARKLHFLPIAEHGDRVVVGMVDPLDLNYTDEIRMLYQRPTQPVFIHLDEFEHHYYRFFRKGIARPVENHSLLDTVSMKKMVLGEDETADTQEEKIAGKFLARIITLAVSNQAAGFAITPIKESATVTLHIDGADYDLFRLSTSNYQRMLAAVRTLAKFGDATPGVDQFGRCQVKINNKTHLLVFSIRPTPDNEKITAHVISTDMGNCTLTDEGFSNQDIQYFEQIITKPGVILVTGSNGAGKSTVLQSMLRHAVGVSEKERRFFSVEDIVGYKLDGVRQLQIKPQGPSKKKILQAIKPQSGDLIAFDEADDEMLPAAIEAAANGCTILLSVSSPGIGEALSWLLSMKVPRTSLASTLKLAFTRRSVRKLCAACKTAATIHQATIAQWQIPSTIKFFTSKGCDSCKNTGFHGTISIAETLPVSSALTDLITQGASSAEVYEKGRYEGMLTMFEQGFNKVIDGITSLEEVIATLPCDEPLQVKSRLRMGRICPLETPEAIAAKADRFTPDKPQEANITLADLASEQTETAPTTSGSDEQSKESPPITPPPPAKAEKEQEKEQPLDDMGLPVSPHTEKPETPLETAPEAPASPTPSEPPTQPATEKAQILLVDDSPVMLKFTHHVLSTSGMFEVDTATTVSEAREKLQAKQYHLVITDHEMPEQTGQEFIAYIRQQPSLNGVGTILLTGNVNEMAALSSGADGYIGKPTDPEILIARAKSISDIYRRMQAAPKPAPSPTTPTKVEFTEKDLSNLGELELDLTIGHSNKVIADKDD